MIPKRDILCLDCPCRGCEVSECPTGFELGCPGHPNCPHLTTDGRLPHDCCIHAMTADEAVDYLGDVQFHSAYCEGRLSL